MSELLDQDALAALVALRRPGKPDLVARVVGLFHQESPKLIAAIAEGLDDCDLEAVRVAAHTLKSSAAYVGARDVSERCARIERAAREGNLVDCIVAADGLDECYAGTARELVDAVPLAA